MLRLVCAGKAYKPRNYLVKEFPELLTMVRSLRERAPSLDKRSKRWRESATRRCSRVFVCGVVSQEKDEIQLLELGCGYGSAVFPILDECPKVRAQVCDFSAHAINVLQQNPRYDPRCCRAFVCDVARDELSGVASGSVDIALLVFVLSALPPASFVPTLQKVFEALRPGGIVCFRDYGLYDLAMMRNAKRLSPSLYYRSDGTLAYFFSKEDVTEIFERQCGFLPLESTYCTVRLTNRKKGVSMDRVWLHAKFQKPW